MGVFFGYGFVWCGVLRFSVLGECVGVLSLACCCQVIDWMSISISINVYNGL